MLTKSKRSRSRTRGWSHMQPGKHERTLMLKRCGRKCFLGKNVSYPICRKGTCKRSPRGTYSAYIRARQQHNTTVSKKALNILKRMHWNRRNKKQ